MGRSHTFSRETGSQVPMPHPLGAGPPGVESHVTMSPIRAGNDRVTTSRLSARRPAMTSLSRSTTRTPTRVGRHPSRRAASQRLPLVERRRSAAARPCRGDRSWSPRRGARGPRAGMPAGRSSRGAVDRSPERQPSQRRCQPACPLDAGVRRIIQVAAAMDARQRPAIPGLEVPPDRSAQIAHRDARRGQRLAPRRRVSTAGRTPRDSTAG